MQAKYLCNSPQKHVTDNVPILLVRRSGTGTIVADTYSGHQQSYHIGSSGDCTQQIGSIFKSHKRLEIVNRYTASIIHSDLVVVYVCELLPWLIFVTRLKAFSLTLLQLHDLYLDYYL